MSIFRCKMCGGTLNLSGIETVAVCEYCGTQQTLPRLEDAHRANLYDRANHFRRSNEFDKAIGIYEQILSEDITDAEAYWSLVLCRYGIEYVEDPATHKRIPTVNRTQYTSIFDDDNYKSALQYADSSQRRIYEDEAKEINRIQKEILAISQQEEPFDVFVCYKETDNSGRRTIDSVLANELYHQLTQEGFKVFFSRITLEDKLGVEYEPYIFAALNSAKVMVVLGTRSEYFHAVWVKNEWKRYLALIKNGANKLLIPAYRDMNPYDLPEEFSHLQAQDMSRLGFMQDLIRGIKKITATETQKDSSVKEAATAPGNVSSAPLLRRAFLFLEDGDWNSANEYCEKVLDIDPENPRAYLGKLMVELQVSNPEDLKEQKDAFDDSNNYKKVIRFADKQLKDTVTGYIEAIHTRKENTGIYIRAQRNMDLAKTETAYLEAARLFESISDFKDSADLAGICREKAETVRQKTNHRKKRRKKFVTIVIPMLCAAAALAYLWNSVIVPKETYENAIAFMENGAYTDAISLLESLEGYKDSAGKIEECRKELLELQYQQACNLTESGEIIEAYEALLALDGYRDSAEKAESISSQYKLEKLKIAETGDSVLFGTYEQDNDLENGKEEIEWLVLHRNEDQILVISRYGLDCQRYNQYLANVSWSTCSLRKWLNEEFLSDAFTEAEIDRIPQVTVPADAHPDYPVYAGAATQDQVFLLSVQETEQYWGDRIRKPCQPTQYAEARGATKNNGHCMWWLRTPGRYPDTASLITLDGLTEYLGVHCDTVAVRPAIWISIGS